MTWIKLNEYVEMQKEPALGSENQEDGKRYMALCIDPDSKNPYRGIAREITERDGSVDVMGYVDRSKLLSVKSEDKLNWRIVGDLRIKGINEKIKELEKGGTYLIGLEDPDIFVDENKEKHVYFTMAYKNKDKDGHKLFIGHAKGKSLDELIITDPVISDNKELAISPMKSGTCRYALAESWNGSPAEGISLLRANDMGKDWEFDKLVFDPKKQGSPWCAGYASPCRLIDQSMFNVGNDLLLGVCTGNSGKHIIDGKEYRGSFEPGLFLFNYKTGDIPWIDDKSLFKDPKAKTITFASELFCPNNKEAILFAHPNDSFVRAYKLNLQKIRERIPSNLR